MSNPLSTLTDSELSELIAGFIEPQPTTHPRGLGRSTQAWVFDSEMDMGGFITGWQPRDFVNAPECTLTLLKKLLASGINPMGCRWDPLKKAWSKFEMDGTEDTTQWEFEQLGRAVAESFCRANGLGE